MTARGGAERTTRAGGRTAGTATTGCRSLERHFDGDVGATTSVTLEFDQRYAMENDYDYGYVDVRSGGDGDTWY